MQTYMIGYDLNKSGKNYEDLIAAIKELANGYWHHLDSTWLINTNLNAGQIRDYLKPHLDSDDELLVIGVSGNWATKGISASGNDWLRNSLHSATKAR
ncbi:hypothetical protein [Martelella sp. AMO21009]